MPLSGPEIVHYLRQPLVGAFIGYITTDVAIRLLFRPLKPWRIFGIRVPLTPGVIPAKRLEFAEKVGVMVGSHLLTSEDVRNGLLKESFHRELQGAVSEKLGDLLSRNFGTFASLFPSDFQVWVRDLVDRLRQKALQDLYTYLESDACAAEVRELLARKRDEFLTQELQTVLPQERYRALCERLPQMVQALLHSPELERGAGTFIDAKIEELLVSEATLRDLIPASLQEVLAQRIEHEVGAVLERVGDDQQFRQHLRRHMEGAFTSAIDSLEGVTGFFAKLIDPGRLLALFPELLGNMEQQITRGLRDETTRRHLTGGVRQGWDRLLDESISDLAGTIPYRKTAALRRLTRWKGVRALQSHKAAHLFASLIEGNLERLRHQQMGSLLAAALSEQGVADLKEGAATAVIAALRAPSARAALERTVSAKIEEWLFQRPIGSLAALIPANGKDELVDLLYKQLAELLVNEVPPLVETINVQQIVEEKVNSLDILQMEGLLLDIMRESFMFLNLFGAFLGFLIGIINVLVPGFGG